MDPNTPATNVIARIAGDDSRYVDIAHADGVDGYVGTVGAGTLHPIRFHMDRATIARMVSELPFDLQAEQRGLDLEAEVLSIVETMAERLATVAGVRWDKVSEPTGDEIVDRETRAYWRLLARTALGL